MEGEDRHGLELCLTGKGGREERRERRRSGFDVNLQSPVPQECHCLAMNWQSGCFPCSLCGMICRLSRSGLLAFLHLSKHSGILPSEYSTISDPHAHTDIEVLPDYRGVVRD